MAWPLICLSDAYIKYGGLPEVKAAKMARILAIVHIIVGFLLICFGIADSFVPYFWTSFPAFGIWSGALVFDQTRQIFIMRKLFKKTCL